MVVKTRVSNITHRKYYMTAPHYKQYHVKHNLLDVKTAGKFFRIFRISRIVCYSTRLVQEGMLRLEMSQRGQDVRYLFRPYRSASRLRSSFESDMR